MLNTYDDNDTVNAGNSTLPMLIFGGFGNDVITGGVSDNVVFGDQGLAQYYTAGPGSVLAAQFGTSGYGDFFDNVVRCLTIAQTTNASITEDGNDVITVANATNTGV